MKRLRRLRSVCGLQLHRWRVKHTRHVVCRADGTAGFALLGDPGATAAFARHYLGVEWLEHARIDSRFQLWGKAGFARREVQKRGLVVFAPGSHGAELSGELLPLDAWVDVAIPLPASIQAYVASLGGSARDDLRRIRRSAYRVEFGRDPAWAGVFLERHHLPAIRGRHGDDGYCSSLDELNRLLAEPAVEWIRVFQGETCIAAVIGERRTDDYFFHRLGWLDGNPALLTDGIVGALYWFAIERALFLGAARLHLGGVAPDLENGLFAYKSKWGARLLSAKSRFETRHLLLDPAHPDARRFLASRSLLFRGGREGFAVLSTRNPDEIPVARAQAAVLSAWFRLRASPCAVVAQAPSHRILPPHLRPWFDGVSIQAGPRPGR